MKPELLAFLTKRGLCTIATINAVGSPEAAFVGYSQTDDLKLYFGTSNKTRKYKNLQNSNKVAIVIADLEGEVQYEGVAIEVTDPSHKTEVQARHIEKVPGAKAFLSDETQTYFEITPTWIRFIQHGETNVIEEFTEFPL
jgi:uncharacterized pyridoxamine 5'-phosphate oxidase family protein